MCLHGFIASAFPGPVWLVSAFPADPHWGWWVIGYFFLGGIAAGAYFTAALIDLRAVQADRGLARLGYAIAFPLILVCGLFLILDLDRPERFWHMLVRSEVVHEGVERGWPWSGDGWSWMVHSPLLKPWSPMSIGSWALLLFGLCSTLSLLGSLWPGGWLERWLRRGVFGRVLQVVGSLVGFFVASYTGALLTATNQPLWSDSTWIAPLFLTSAASTGLASLYLFGRLRGTSPETLQRLTRAEMMARGLEAVVFMVFLSSIWVWLAGAELRSGPVSLLLLLGGVLLVGLLIPLLLQVFHGYTGRWSGIAGALLVLLGGLLLRYAIVSTPPQILARRGAIDGLAEPGAVMTPRSPLPSISPEDGRRAGEGRGADPGNRPADLQPRTKFASEP